MTEDEVLSPELEDRLRRGLELLAEETPAAGAARRTRMRRLQTATLGAAAALAAVLAGPALVDGLNGSSTSQHDTATSAPESASAPMADRYAGQAATAGGEADDAAAKSLSAPVPGPNRETSPEMSADAAVPPTTPEGVGQNAFPAGSSARMAAYDLKSLVAGSSRIVVGKVAEVTKADGVTATLQVEDTLRGPADARVVAFDDSAQPAAFTVGDRMLVFLADAGGRLQLVGGSQGAYRMNGPEPEAPFTLAGVRAEIERQVTQGQ